MLSGLFVFHGGGIEIDRTAVLVEHVRVIDVHVGREARQVAEVRKHVQEKQNSPKPHPERQDTNGTTPCPEQKKCPLQLLSITTLNLNRL